MTNYSLNIWGVNWEATWKVLKDLGVGGWEGAMIVFTSLHQRSYLTYWLPQIQKHNII